MLLQPIHLLPHRLNILPNTRKPLDRAPCPRRTTVGVVIIQTLEHATLIIKQ
ncbi:predicted protein [Plenodomus lingam JN3]|uniref:Uncharacterized protein n=1 Tax=Leptosphaeria maculans (strain JN3 / isolate v23.1.3 / race Av1-4-5-6-7-8) TaxID=985895 RepID=E5A6T9_LEPMJ|nr:predicted protein [Plenodomus lingam JN3]CBX99334.1 predicted protein [Plenodomus lingam JN3]